MIQSTCQVSECFFCVSALHSPPLSQRRLNRETKASCHDFEVRRIGRHFGLADLFPARPVLNVHGAGQKPLVVSRRGLHHVGGFFV